MHQSWTVSILAVAFLTLTLCGWGVFSLGHIHAMHEGECQFIQQVVGTLTTPSLGTLLVLLCVGMIVSTVTRRDTALISQRHYLHHEPDTPLWQPLQLAFSDGILNPKTF